MGRNARLRSDLSGDHTATRPQRPTDVDELITLLGEYVGVCIARFTGVDRTASAFEQIVAAQERVAGETPVDPQS